MKIKYIILVLFLFGCSTSKVKLVSEPQSTVYVSSDFSSEFKELGKTPLDVNLKDHASEDNFAYLAFKAEGFDNYRVVLPTKYNNGSVEIKLNEQQKVTDEEMKKELEDKLKSSFESQIQTLNALIKTQQEVYQAELDKVKTDLKQDYLTRSAVIFNKVIEIQNALHIKKMAKAAKVLAELRVLEAPESLVLTLEGNFEFISGKYNRAVASYQRALAVDPENVELAGIIKDLKKVVK